MLTLDGSIGEGGGQIVRSALSLSLVTGTPFHLANIRSGRKKPGLQAQHLTAVRAAALIGQAKVEGDQLQSQELTFQPEGVLPGDYAFDIGTAGSVTLLLQTLLPALMIQKAPSALLLEGGTHNPMAPTFEFLAKTYLPLINQMGPAIRVKLDRHGFYPVGGGKVRATIQPASEPLRPWNLTERGPALRTRCVALLAQLPAHIAERELKVLRRELHLDSDCLRIEPVKGRCPANVLWIEVEWASLTEIFTGFGELGVKAEIVAGRTAKEAQHYLNSGAPVGEYLADQLLLPLALAGGGEFVTLPLSRHAQTQIEIIRRFLPVEIKSEPATDESIRVAIRRLPPLTA